MRYRYLYIAGLSVALLGSVAASQADSKTDNTDRTTTINSAPETLAYVVMDGSNSIAVLDLKQKKVIDRIAVSGNPHGGAITPNGKSIYTASMGANSIQVIDTATRTVKDTIEIGSITHHSEASPDGKYIYTAADEVVVIDTADNRIVDRIPTQAPPFALAFSPDGSRLYVLGISSSKSGSSITVIDPQTRRVTATIAMTGTSMMGHIAFAPDGREFYVTNDKSAMIAVIDVASAREVARIPVGKGPHGITTTADGRRIIVANRGQTDLSVIDAQSRKVIATQVIGKRPEHLARSADGRYVLLSRNTGANEILLLDPVSLKTTAAIEVWATPHTILFAAGLPG